MHQGSAFVIVMDALSREFRVTYHRSCMRMTWL